MFSYSLYVVCCLYVTFLLPQEQATKAGPYHLLSFILWTGYDCSKIGCQEFSGLILFPTNRPLIFSVTIIRVSATDIIHQVSSVTLNISTSVTLQNNTLQSIEPFTFHVTESHICSHSLEWIQMSVIYIAILDLLTRHSICARDLEAHLFLSAMSVSFGKNQGG